VNDPDCGHLNYSQSCTGRNNVNIVIKRIRHEERGFLKGYKGSHFELRYHVEFTDEEAIIIRECRLESCQIEFTPLPSTEIPPHTIGSLQQGMQVPLSTPLQVAYYIHYLKRACDILPLILDMYAPPRAHQMVEVYPITQPQRVPPPPSE
jgi:hypothetical protein